MLDLRKDLKSTYCFICFDNLFNRTTFLNKLHDEGLHDLGTVRSRGQMPEMKGDKQIQRGDHQIKYCKNIA